jgi:hypothetical protein
MAGLHNTCNATTTTCFTWNLSPGEHLLSKLAGSGPAFSISPSSSFLRCNGSVLHKASKHEEASASLPASAVPLDSTAPGSSVAFLLALFPVHVLEFGLMKIFARLIHTEVGTSLVHGTSGEPDTVSPSTTALHSFLFLAVQVAFTVGSVSIPSNCVAAEALSFILQGDEFVTLLTC